MDNNPVEARPGDFGEPHPARKSRSVTARGLFGASRWRLRSGPLGNLVLLTVAVDLKRAQVMNQIPCVIGLHHIRERRHRSSIKTGHEDAIEILIAAATLEASVVAGVR